MDINTHIDLLDLCIYMHNKFGKAASSPITRMIFFKGSKEVFIFIYNLLWNVSSYGYADEEENQLR